MKYIVIILLVALIVVYGDFLLSKMGKEAPGMNFEKLKGEGFFSFFDPRRINDEFVKEVKELKAEAPKARELIKNKLKSYLISLIPFKNLFIR